MDAIYEELHRLESADEVSESLKEIFSLVGRIYSGMGQFLETL